MLTKTIIPLIVALCGAVSLPACSAPDASDGSALGGSSQPSRTAGHATPFPHPGDIYGPVRGSVP